MYVFCYVFLNI